MERQIRSFLKEHRLGMALFFNTDPGNANFQYVSGFTGLGVAVIRAAGRPFLLVPEPEYHIAKKEARLPVINLGTLRAGEYLKRKYPSELNKGVGLDHHSLTVEQHKGLIAQLDCRDADIWAVIRDMRMIKRGEETEKIRKACLLTERILGDFRKQLRSFRTEADAAAFLISSAMKNGAEVSFPPIVASGKNAGKWHHTPETTKLADGFLIVDFGVRLQGYCSDLTRTYHLGRPGRSEVAAYESVRKAQENAIAMMKPGNDLQEIQKTVSKALGRRFCHSLGHGIGLEVHESPHFGNRQLLTPGMCLAVEPGIYEPYRYGIRIEDDVVITRSGAKRLNRSSRSLIII